MKTDLEGLIEGISNEHYHSGPGVSFSGFKKFMKSPSKYKAWLDRKDTEKQTASQKLGTAGHCAILEPALFLETYVRIDGPMNTNPWKAMKTQAEAEGKIPIGAEDFERVIGMRDAVMKHDLAKRLVTLGKSELSAYSKHPVYGFVRKCRPDHFIHSKLIISDLKTCDDASPAGVEMLLKRNKWGHQGAWYLDVLGEVLGTKLNQFVHIFVETDPPHDIGLYALDDETLERCRMEIDLHLKRFAKCLETDTWPGLDPGIQTLNLPYYHFSSEGEIE